MDKITVGIYDSEAVSIASFHESFVPDRLYQLALEFFLSNGKTIDIGCGCGRDSAWLYKNGFEVLGIDASSGMLNQANKRHPEINFLQAELPQLSRIPDSTFTNALCSAVLMHLERDVLPLAAQNILRILTKGAILLVSIRGSKEVSKRENGKLYETFTKEEMMTVFEHEGAELLIYESTLEAGRNHLWHTFVFRK